MFAIEQNAFYVEGTLHLDVCLCALELFRFGLYQILFCLIEIFMSTKKIVQSDSGRGRLCLYYTIVNSACIGGRHCSGGAMHTQHTHIDMEKRPTLMMRPLGPIRQSDGVS